MSKKGDKIYVEGYWRSSTNKPGNKNANKITTKTSKNINKSIKTSVCGNQNSNLTLSDVGSVVNLINISLDLGMRLYSIYKSYKKPPQLDIIHDDNVSDDDFTDEGSSSNNNLPELFR
jgi:hypothetical protein